MSHESLNLRVSRSKEKTIEATILKKLTQLSHFFISYTNTYMWHLEMALMKLFAGQQWRHRHRERTYV